MPLAPIPHAVRLDLPGAALLAVVVPDGHEAAASWAGAVADLPERRQDLVVAQQVRDRVVAGDHQRHPGYAFGFLLFHGMPLALGFLWAPIPAAMLCPLLVARTVLEDRTLQAELPGYRGYAQRVRYRPLPGIW
jgi:protein-S-isoprenylcysteine O-methyltransferase Ste14